ncbi:MAG: FAD-dependent thymidylate synthase [Betaproteobacteria bacterium]|jgi:thymidylate synthase (FAD)
MRIITRPNITLISEPTFIEHPDYKIPSDGTDATKIGAFAAKGCYDSYGVNGRLNEANQLALLEHRHGSVLEHINIGLFIEGITRGLSLELNRHRSFAISQRSTRYTAEEDSCLVLEPYFALLWVKYHCTWDTTLECVVPNNMEATLNSEEIKELSLIKSHVESQYHAVDQYTRQVEMLDELNPNNLEGFDLRKWSRGKARNVLPHGLETRGTWTNNVRGWRWFIESRSDKHAEPEIRRLAVAVCSLLRTKWPVYFDDFDVTEIYDNIPVLVPRYNKV